MQQSGELQPLVSHLVVAVLVLAATVTQRAEVAFQDETGTHAWPQYSNNCGKQGLQGPRITQFTPWFRHVKCKLCFSWEIDTIKGRSVHPFSQSASWFLWKSPIMNDLAISQKRWVCSWNHPIWVGHLTNYKFIDGSIYIYLELDPEWYWSY